jgi:predicted short-subunit dehydrogenase-like oxidoreductase (DUF2520 family)
LSPEQADLEARLCDRSVGAPADDLRERVLARVARELSASRQQALRTQRFNWQAAAALAAGFVVMATLASVGAQTTRYGLAAQRTVLTGPLGRASASVVDVPLAGAYRQAQILAREVQWSGAARSRLSPSELPQWSQGPLREVAP